MRRFGIIAKKSLLVGLGAGLLIFATALGIASAANGLNAGYYNADDFYRLNWNAVGTPDASQVDLNINFDWQPSGPDPLPSAIVSDGFWSADWKGFIKTPSSGVYSFATTSDDGSMVYIDSLLVVNNGGDHGPTHVDGAPVTLTAGTHSIVVKYFESFGGPAQLYLYWTVPSASEVIVPQSVLLTENTQSPVPGPGTMVLLASGMLSLAALRRRKKN